MDFALRIAAIAIGCLVVVSFFRSIMRTTLLRSRRGDVLVASTHFVLAVIFRVIGRRARGSKLDSTAFWYMPVSEFTLMFVWFGLALTGFAGLYYSAGISRSITDAFISSGSALSTLDFHTPASSGGQILSIAEGTIGLIAMVYLVTFMPGVLAFTR